MRRSLLFLSILSLVLILAACASEPATAPADEAATAAPDASADPVSGTWTGDWGPTETHRNNVTLELKLDGTAVTGNVNPGPDAVPLTKGTFASATGMIMMEADAKGQGERRSIMRSGESKDDDVRFWTHDKRATSNARLNAFCSPDRGWIRPA
jgi:hypothetical protein